MKITKAVIPVTGLGHTISCARPLVNDEPFVVMLPDDLIDEYRADLSKDNLKAMIDCYEQTRKSQILVEKVEREELSPYGVIDIPDETKAQDITKGQSIKITGFVEKPLPEQAPSSLAIIGRYVLSPTIWDLLKENPVGPGDEIQLTDNLKLLLKEVEIEGHVLKRRRLDYGSKFGYVKVFIEYAMMHPQLKADVVNYLNNEVIFHD